MPIIDDLIRKSPLDKDLQTLVIVPTRELAIQIAKDFEVFSSGSGLKVATLYGGQNISLQFKDLRQKPQVVVGTPGRLVDHIRRKL